MLLKYNVQVCVSAEVETKCSLGELYDDADVRWTKCFGDLVKYKQEVVATIWEMVFIWR